MRRGLAAVLAVSLIGAVTTPEPTRAAGPAPSKADHWSFQPVRRPEPPTVRDAGWPRNPIDRFILAHLEAKNLTHAPEADRYTLIRRLYLDLLGLTPPVAEVDAFVGDMSTDAYEKLVERILASPHYGERWGRHWLDQARYADSDGYSIDGNRTMWPYRDWVIRALNEDMPFDQFTIEQIAGDLVAKPTQQQLVATGFHRNTLINSEGGTDREQFRVEINVDRVNTTGAVWLGLTIGCAQCHDHKFDPLTQRDFYQLFAFFNRAEDANNSGPTVRVAPPELLARIDAADKALASAEDALKQHDAARDMQRDAWEREIASKVEQPAWTVLAPANPRASGTSTLKLQSDHSVLAGGEASATETFEIDAATGLTGVTGVRLEALADPSLPKKGPGRSSAGNFVLTAFEVEVAPAASDAAYTPVAFAAAVADHQQRDMPVTGAIDGKSDTGWAPEGYARHEDRVAVFTAAKPFGVEGGSRLRIRLKHESKHAGYTVGRFRVALTTTPNPRLGDKADKLADALTTPADKRSKAQSDLIDAEFRKSDAARPPLVAKIDALKKERDGLNKSIPTTMVMRDLDQPRQTHVMIRGDFLRPGDEVKPDTPAALPAFRPASDDPNRLDLAHWLVSPENPLTARVAVNRIWMHYFGRGIVETENDFGTQGTPPTHPLLLDWLADEFRTGRVTGKPWSLKAMHKLIVTSATYRQSSSFFRRDDLLAADPQNLLLGRQSRYRVEAEVVRDLALSASGLLSDKVGGPSVYPPQPEGVYDFTQNRKTWRTSEGDDRFRRGMYTFFYRSAPYPMLSTFDTPRFDTTCTQRVRSNTPLQALTMANSDATFEIAQGLASRVLREAATDDARMTLAFRLCMARPPVSTERDRLLAYLHQQTERFASDAEAAKTVAPKTLPQGMNESRAAAWATVARALINLDEFVTRE